MPLHELVREDVVGHDGEDDGGAPKRPTLAASDALPQAAVAHPAPGRGLENLKKNYRVTDL